MSEKYRPIWIQNHTRAGTGVRGRKGRTIRFEIPCQMKGSALRISFCNLFSQEDDLVGPMSLHRNGKVYEVKVNGEKVFKVGKDCHIDSDPIKADLAKGEILEFRLFCNSREAEGNQTVRNAVWSVKGDFTEQKEFPLAFAEKRKRGEGIVRYIPNVERIEVLNDEKPYVIAAMGDSIVQQSQWTNRLYERISDRNVVLLNAGIGGNRICNDGEGFYKMFGPSGIHRLESDLLSLEELDLVIFALGTNDIGMGKKGKKDYVSYEEMIKGTEFIVSKLHEKGVKVIGTTILPRKGSSGYSKDYDVENRRKYNEWVLNGNGFDDVIDFAKILHDEKDPEKLPDDCCLFDKVHPNGKGGKIIAEAIDLNVLCPKSM